MRLTKPEGKDWTPVIIALLSLAVSALAIGVNAWQKNRELTQSLSLKDKELKQTIELKQRELDTAFGLRAREEERAELLKQLTGFYGPLKQHLDLAFVLYKRLCDGDPQGRTRDGFRTLEALLDEVDFSKNDRAIIGELLLTTEAIRQLIMKAEGSVDDEELLHKLSVAAAHFRILGLAGSKVIVGESARFKSSTYPRDLDGLLEQKIQKIRARVRELGAS